MATLKTFEKQPDDVQDWDIDFGEEWLPDMGDSAPGPTGLVVTADPGITIDSYQLRNGVAKVWTSGGTSGVKYKITATLTTTNIPPRVKQAEITVKVKEI